MVEKCPLVMDGFVTYVYLNVIPLGSYGILTGMDWLEAHREKIDCYNKTFEWLDEEGNLIVMKGFPKVISSRNISAMKLKKLSGKVAECMQLMFWRKQRMILLGWRDFMCCKKSRMFSS